MRKATFHFNDTDSTLRLRGDVIFQGDRMTFSHNPGGRPRVKGALGFYNRLHVTNELSASGNTADFSNAVVENYTTESFGGKLVNILTGGKWVVQGVHEKAELNLLTETAFINVVRTEPHVVVILAAGVFVLFSRRYRRDEVI